MDDETLSPREAGRDPHSEPQSAGLYDEHEGGFQGRGSSTSLRLLNGQYSLSSTVRRMAHDQLSDANAERDARYTLVPQMAPMRTLFL